MVASRSKRPDLVETEIKPALTVYAEGLISRIETIRDEWQARIKRILELRQEQKKKIELIRDGFDDEQVKFFIFYTIMYYYVRVISVIWFLI